MSTTTQPSERRGGSYILITSSSTPLDDSASLPSDDAPVSPSRRPRLFLLLPLISLLDIATALTLSILILRRQPPSQPPPDPIITHPIPSSSNEPWERKKLLFAVLIFSLARTLSYLIITLSKRIRQLGVTVAAISILSTLFYLSIANLLFQARPKPDIKGERWNWDARNFRPTMSVLVGVEIGWTMLEWVLFIAVVGVRVQPRGRGRRLSEEGRGVQTRSLYDEDEEEGEGEAGKDVAEQEGERLPSPISLHSPEETSKPLLGTSPHTPRGYGSTLVTPKTPQGGSIRKSGSFSRSPSAAELGPNDDPADISTDLDPDEESGAEGSDPDDIIDITPNRVVARKEARLRLARAALPVRRASVGTLGTISIFSAEGAGRGSGLFSDEMGSPVARHAPVQAEVQRESLVGGSRQSSTSFLPSNASTRTVSTRGSGKERKFRLPKWMKPKKKAPS